MFMPPWCLLSVTSVTSYYLDVTNLASDNTKLELTTLKLNTECDDSDDMVFGLRLMCSDQSE